MWEKVGDPLGERKRGSEKAWRGGANPLKSRKGFGYDVREARRRPGNLTVRDFLGNETEDVLEFWEIQVWGQSRMGWGGP